jgi:transposase
METTTYTSKTLDHLGLIAGLIQEIGISELVDSCYAEQSPDQKVSNGKTLEAMIINVLGFVNKRLYLVPQFFEDKPIARLLGEGFEASHFNDDWLGRALDAFYEAGVTPLFAKISRHTFEVLSSTSFLTGIFILDFLKGGAEGVIKVITKILSILFFIQ